MHNVEKWPNILKILGQLVKQWNKTQSFVFNLSQYMDVVERHWQTVLFLFILF